MSRQNACAHGQRSDTTDSHWWHQSASHKWSRKNKFELILVSVVCTESRILKAVIVTWKRDVVITVTARHTLDRKRVLHLSAGQYPTHMVLEAINFLTHNFAGYRLILKICYCRLPRYQCSLRADDRITCIRRVRADHTRSLRAETLDCTQ